jgi:ABC-type spermidine/putrescine transport system permease subunit I
MEALMKNEPAITVAGITAAVAALIGLLVAFGVSLSDDQQKAILGAVAVIAPLVAGYVTRGKVTPGANVDGPDVQ